ERPFVLIEYSHAMGNSNGNLKDYWDIIRSHPERLQGGYIWDFVDQSLWTKVPAKRTIQESGPKKLTAAVARRASIEPTGLSGKATFGNDPSLDLTSSVTLEAVVTPQAQSMSQGTIASKGDHQYALKQNGTSLSFYIYGTNGGWTEYGTAVPATGWVGKQHRVAGVYDKAAGNIKLYIDGALAGRKNVAGPMTASDQPFMIGGESEHSDRAFVGEVSGVRLYDRALSAAEVADAGRTSTDPAVRLWFDASATTITETGGSDEKYLAYGGDWGDEPNDGNFVGNGIVLADRTETPKTAEVKQVYQDIQVAADDVVNGEVAITNEALFRNVNEYDVTWQLLRDATVVQQGTLSPAEADVAPGTTKTVDIPFTKPASLPAGSEYWLNVQFRLKSDTLWADKGYVQAKQQLEVPFGAPGVVPADLSAMPSLTSQESTDEVTVSGDGFAVTVDKKQGTLSSFTSQGQELLRSGPRPNYWRAPTDNDVGTNLASTARTWRYAGRDWAISDVEVEPLLDKAVRVTVTGTVPTTTPSKASMTYTVFGDGQVKVSSTLTPGSSSLPFIPEVGTMMTLPSSLETLTWYGRGPHESMLDRKASADVGEYSGAVSDQVTKYLRPQESGNKTDVRWAALTDPSGNGLLVSGDGVLEVNASHYTPEDLSQVIGRNGQHWYDTPARDEVVLRVNLHQMGVGSDDSWGAPTHDEYKLFANRSYGYSYRLAPIRTGQDAMQLSRRAVAADLVTDLRVDGTTVSGFTPGGGDYAYTAFSGEPTPTVEVDTAAGVTVERGKVTVPGTYRVVATSPDGKRTEAYTIRFTSTDVSYLSDRQWASATTGWGSIGRDVSVDGNPIRVRSADGSARTYAKGLGVHADSQLVYELSKLNLSRFQAVVGVDQEVPANAKSSVEFRVLLDGKEAFDSGAMTRGTAAVPVDLDVRGVKQLTLITGDSGNGNQEDHTDWADAKLIAAPSVPMAAADDLSFPVGRSSAAALATVTASGMTASQLSATIDWGDGSTTTGTLAGPTGNWGVFGSHAYAEAGAYTVAVRVSGPGGAVGTSMTTIRVG
ncbi:beta-galactosidase small subunit-related protein, partial [Motilibacter deserti]